MADMTVFGWLFWWLVLIFCERKVLLAGWCWFCVREKYCWLDAVKMKRTVRPLPALFSGADMNYSQTITCLMNTS